MPEEAFIVNWMHVSSAQTRSNTTSGPHKQDSGAKADMNKNKKKMKKEDLTEFLGCLELA